MKKLGINLMMMALLGCATLTTALANETKMSGKNKSKTIMLSEEMLVNDTLLKRGEYRVKFDAANRLVTIYDLDGDVVAAVPANVQLRNYKAEYNSFHASTTARGKVMTGLTFEGDKRFITLGEADTNVAGQGAQQR